MKPSSTQVTTLDDKLGQSQTPEREEPTQEREEPTQESEE